ncbi:MAG: ATP-dependent RecD-like DNA helicase [Clostridia bacterium]|nr:ATP-dependent RecD-like DNA helicase [Clostridia bacterium]
MQINGKVSSLIYHNEKNGYTVFLLKAEDDYITAVGDGTGVEVGDKVKIEGDFTYHKTYGEQFSFTKLDKEMPSDADSLIKYIADSKIKGLGEKTAEKIIKKFGDDALEVIRYKPDLLLDIKGMNEAKADALSEYINSEWERWNLTSFLSKSDIGLKMSMKIYDALGINAINIIKENPYALMDFVSSMDFKTADKLASNLNVDKTSKERVSAGIIYLISYFIKEGNTCVEQELLTEYALRMLEVSRDCVTSAYEQLVFKDKIQIEEVNDKIYVYRKSIYNAEKSVAEHLKELTQKPSNNFKLDKEIDAVSQDLSIVLSETQIEAIKMCINNNLSVITGGPGTGKTTIIKCIIDILKRRGLTYVLAAPTGRAAKRITETTGENAKTLHRMLEITKTEDADFDTMVNYPIDVIDTDVIIVDEASMIDILLMNNLVKGLKSSTKLIIVGDADQLPSVGPGKVLKDIIDSGIAHTCFLTEIYRQSLKSDIVLNAHNVKAGERIEFKKEDTDMYFIETESLEETVKEVETLLDYRLKSKYDEGFLGEIQVLTPIKKSSVGVYELNKVLQKVKLNPTSDMIHRKSGDRIFYENDKVMQIVNNYDKNWDLNGVQGNGIYNGDIGKVVKINTTEQYLIVEYDDCKKAKYDFDELDQLEHAYAITIHKSQGSEFNTVIIPLYICYEKLFNRNLIYTAMTRAKNLLIFVGRRQVIDYMVNNTNEKTRITGLKRKLEM